MAYGNLLTDVVQSSTTGTPPVFKDGNGSEIGVLCKAWVKTGSSTSILGSFNVSSVTYSSGLYTINFTTAFPDTNYSYTYGFGSGTAGALVQQGTVTTSSLPLQGFTSTTGGNLQLNNVCVAVFR